MPGEDFLISLFTLLREALRSEYSSELSLIEDVVSMTLRLRSQSRRSDGDYPKYSLRFRQDPAGLSFTLRQDGFAAEGIKKWRVSGEPPIEQIVSTVLRLVAGESKRQIEYRVLNPRDGTSLDGGGNDPVTPIRLNTRCGGVDS